MAAYMRCLRCAGAPRRPTSGSGLSLSIPSQHAALYDPGESRHRHRSVSDAEHGLRRDLNSSALPLILRSVSRRARISGLLEFTFATACQVARPPVTDQTGLPSLRGLLLPGFQQVSHLSCRWISLQQWSELLLLAGLSPARMAASLAAPNPLRTFAPATAAMIEDTIPLFSFPAVQGKKVTAAFDDGRMSSHGGVLLLSLAERRLGVAERLARCIPDRRDRSRLAHTIADMIQSQYSGSSRRVATGVRTIATSQFDEPQADVAAGSPGTRMASSLLIRCSSIQIRQSREMA